MRHVLKLRKALKQKSRAITRLSLLFPCLRQAGWAHYHTYFAMAA